MSSQIDIVALADKRAEHKFNFGGGVVRIEYYPHKITSEYMARLQKLGKVQGEAEEPEGGEDQPKSEEQKSADALMVSELLISWDVLAAGEPFPPTYENLLKAPTSLVSRVAAEIVDAVGKLATPKKQKC
jgi:hypothetical protein